MTVGPHQPEAIKPNGERTVEQHTPDCDVALGISAYCTERCIAARYGISPVTPALRARLETLAA